MHQSNIRFCVKDDCMNSIVLTLDDLDLHQGHPIIKLSQFSEKFEYLASKEAKQHYITYIGNLRGLKDKIMNELGTLFDE